MLLYDGFDAAHIFPLGKTRRLSRTHIDCVLTSSILERAKSQAFYTGWPRFERIAS